MAFLFHVCKLLCLSTGCRQQSTYPFQCKKKSIFAKLSSQCIYVLILQCSLPTVTSIRVKQSNSILLHFLTQYSMSCVIFLYLGTDGSKSQNSSVRDPKDRALPPEPVKPMGSKPNTSCTKPPTSQTQG